MSIILRRCSVALALLFIFVALPAFAQYQTPTLDGTVTAGEYAQTSGVRSLGSELCFSEKNEALPGLRVGCSSGTGWLLKDRYNRKTEEVKILAHILRSKNR